MDSKCPMFLFYFVFCFALGQRLGDALRPVRTVKDVCKPTFRQSYFQRCCKKTWHTWIRDNWSIDFIALSSSGSQNSSLLLHWFPKCQFPEGNTKKVRRHLYIHYKKGTLSLGNLNVLYCLVLMPALFSGEIHYLHLPNLFTYKYSWNDEME